MSCRIKYKNLRNYNSKEDKEKCVGVGEKHSLPRTFCVYREKNRLVAQNICS